MCNFSAAGGEDKGKIVKLGILFKKEEPLYPEDAIILLDEWTSDFNQMSIV